MATGRFGMVPTIAIQDERVTPALLRVLCGLSTHSAPREWFRLRQATLAEELGLTVSVVQRHVSALVKLGYVQARAMHREDGTQTSNAYRIVYDLVGDPNPTDVAEGTPTNAVGGSPASNGGAVTDLQLQTLENIPTRASMIEDDFNAWWQEWPRKADRAKALKQYRARRLDGFSPEQLLWARNNYLPTVRDVQFCKYGATFLGTDCVREWLDPPQNTKPQPTGSKWDRLAEGDLRRRQEHAQQ